jgi:CDP-glucose 4,6-dehydratase
MSKISLEFWDNKKVFVTGHTGFKGSWLVLLLKTLGAKVAGYSLAPSSTPSLFQAAQLSSVVDMDVIADIRDTARIKGAMNEFQPDVVLHLAAQALVRESFKDPMETWTTNVTGTVAVLEAVRTTGSVKALGVVTTDKCYWNDGQDVAFVEKDPLGGKDPYSASKAAAEMVACSHYHAFFKSERPDLGTATLRAGNIVGGGDWSNDRLMTDIIRSMLEGKELSIRMPNAVRPWQYVLDALRGYLLAMEYVSARPGTLEQWNFAPEPFPQIQVQDILQMAKKAFPEMSWTTPEGVETREARTLSLDALKAYQTLGWKPDLTPEELISRTVNWYDHYYKKQDARQLCQAELNAYLGRA